MDRLSLEHAQELLRAVAEVHVLVVGDLMLDKYLSGRVDRISPEAPVPVVRVERECTAVGGAANVAANITALEASCTLVGLVGDDAQGEDLVRRLKGLGIRSDGVVRTAVRPTTVKTRVMARHQQVVRYDQEDDGDVSPETAATLAEALRELAPSCHCLVLEDYNKGLLVPSVIEAAFRAAREAGIPTVVDPKRLRFFDYGGATVLKPNAKELEEALTDTLRFEDPGWMTAARDRLGCQNLLVTLGEKGMALVTAEGECLRVPTAARDIYDVSGAGDTVTAVVAATIAAGATVYEAAILANHAAAVEVSKLGVATVSPEEILEHCRSFRDE